MREKTAWWSFGFVGRGEKCLSTARQLEMSTIYSFRSLIPLLYKWPCKCCSGPEIHHQKVTWKSGTESQKQASHQLLTVSQPHGLVPCRGIKAGVKNLAIKLARVQFLQWQDADCVQHCTDEVVILQMKPGADLTSPWQGSVLCNIPASSSQQEETGAAFCSIDSYSCDLVLLSDYKPPPRALEACTSTWTLVQCPVASGSQKHEFRSF